MQWQDIVITVGSWIFAIALIPSIRGKNKPELSSSVMTGSLLTVYIFVFGSLELLGSAISSAVVALCWWILAYQKWRLNKKENSGNNIQ